MSDDLFDDLLAELGVDAKPYELRSRQHYQVLVLDDAFINSFDTLVDEVVNKVTESPKPTVIRFGSDTYQKPEVAAQLFKLAQKVGKSVNKVKMVPGKALPSTLASFGAKDMRHAVEAVGGSGGGEVPWDFIELFKDATLESLQGQLNLSADTEVKVESPSDATTAIASGVDSEKVYKSMIKLEGESIRGAAIISMEQQVLLNLMSKMLGEKQNSPTEAVVNGVAEIVNLVCGRAKGQLNELGYQVKLASTPAQSNTPEFDKALKPLEGAQSVKIQFKTIDGAFELELKVLPSFQID